MIPLPDRIIEEFEPIGPVEERENVILLRNRTTGERCILKEYEKENREVLESLLRLHIEGIPAIRLLLEAPEEKLLILEEEIRGERLDVFVDNRKNTLDEAWVFGFLDRITRILGRLHRAVPPLIHRDIKPENMMIGESGEVWLLDFNISRLYDNHAAKGRTNRDTHIMGTAGYAAPEQYGFMESDARSDIYSLGATLEYILNRTGLESAALAKISKRCMQFNPADRYQNVEELRRALLPGMPEACGTDIVWPEKGFFVGKNGSSLYRNYHRNFPPGFRRGSLWRMLFATFIYYLLGYAIMQFLPDINKVQEKYYHADILLNRISLAVTMIVGLLFTCNFRNIWSYNTQLQRLTPAKRAVMILLADILLFFLLVIFVVSVEAFWKS